MKKNFKKYIWPFVNAIAVYTLSYILLDNQLIRLSDNEVILASGAITVVVVFLLKKLTK